MVPFKYGFPENEGGRTALDLAIQDEPAREKLDRYDMNARGEREL